MQTERIKTPRFTLCFPAVFEPRASVEGQEPKYSVVAVFPKDTDLSALKRIARDAATAKWPNGFPKNMRNPFLDGDDANPEWGEVFKNAVYVRFSSKYKPPVCDGSRREIVDPESVYGGQTCVAIVHAFAYSNAGNNGVSLGLDALQVVADGERIGFSKEAAFQQFDQIAPAQPSPTDMFDTPASPSPAAAPVQASSSGAVAGESYDPFA